MKNSLKFFVFFTFLALASCSKEPILIPQSNAEMTISLRSSTSVEMAVANVAYDSETAELIVDLEATGDFTDAVIANTQTLDFQNNTSVSLAVTSYSGAEGSLQIVFNVNQDLPIGLAEAQEIIIEDGGFE